MMNLAKLIAPALLLAVCLTATGCQDQIKTSDEDLKQLTYAQAVDLLQNTKKAAVLLDPRPPAKFEKAHLPGAINIPMPDLIAGHPDLARAKSIIVYGAGWSDYLSSAAAKKMIALGYKNIYDFRGGIEQWKAEGGRVLEATPTTAPAK
jgi:rhodanese-related sulfurtransferase